MSSFKTATSRLREWRLNPPLFAEQELGIVLDNWQIEGLKAVGGDYNPRRRAAFAACTGPGKSFLLAIAGWHRLVCYGEPGEHPKGAAVSGLGSDNLKDNLWAELSKIQQRSQLLRTAFTWTKERIYANDHPETWFLSARSYAKDADPEAMGRALSGLHSKYPFLLLDEIGDMPVTLGQKALQIFTGGVQDALIMAAGNTTSTTGLLYNISTKQRDMWKLIKITADPDDPNRTPRVDIEHAREQIRLYGRDNPWIKATILGEFPDSAINTLLSLTDCERAIGRYGALNEEIYKYSQKRLGVDVAREGLDSTVLFPRQGLRLFKPVVMRGANNLEVAARILQAKKNWQYENVFVDNTGGFGGGVIDTLRQAGEAPYAIHFSQKAIDKRYFNKRAEMWFNMAEWVKNGGCLPDIPQLINELTSVTYTTKDGKLLMEPKEHLKKRLGFSPDHADAFALTFALPEMPAAIVDNVEIHHLMDQNSKMKSDYDELNE